MRWQVHHENKFSIRKMKPLYHPNRTIKREEVEHIVTEEVVRNRNVAAAMAQYLQSVMPHSLLVASLLTGVPRPADSTVSEITWGDCRKGIRLGRIL